MLGLYGLKEKSSMTNRSSVERNAIRGGVSDSVQKFGSNDLDFGWGLNSNPCALIDNPKYFQLYLLARGQEQDQRFVNIPCQN